MRAKTKEILGGPQLPVCLLDAQDRLANAVGGLDAFMVLLSGYNGSSCLEAQQIFWLVNPLHQLIIEALDELNVAAKSLRGDQEILPH